VSASDPTSSTPEASQPARVDSVSSAEDEEQGRLAEGNSFIVTPCSDRTVSE